MSEILDKFPEIITALQNNNNGLIALIWLISAVSMHYIFHRSNQKIKAVIFLYSLTAVCFIIYMIISTSKEIIAQQEGWIYYEVDAQGQPTIAGRVEPLIPTRRQYQELMAGDHLRAIEAKPLYDNATTPREMVSRSQPHECLEVLQAGFPFDVEEAASGGWVRVRVISCAR